MKFSVLGPLHVTDDDRPLVLGPFKQRVVLAGMLCRPNTVLTVDELMDMIWSGGQPRTARKNLQVYLSALRKIVGDRIHHVAYGYSLEVSAEEHDLMLFARLATQGRQARFAGRTEAAARLWADALALVHDRPLIDLRANPHLAAESDAIASRCLDVYEDWAELEIVAGRHRGLVEDLRRRVRANPFRERLVLALMTVLARSGDRSEALAQYETHRQLMARELGLTPSSVLQQQYQAVLADAAPDLTPRSNAGRPRSRSVQLPGSLPDFVGRRQETEMLLASLVEGTTAIVVGPPGIGKTVLAIQVGHQLSRRFPDGQVLVAMRDAEGAPRPWRAVLDELVRNTGMSQPSPGDVTPGQWRSWVADRRFLFVLDDAREEAPLRRVLPGTGSSASLVTSSFALGALTTACRCELGELSDSEAAALFEPVVARNQTHAGNAAAATDAVRSILAVCGPHPLAIRAILARLATLHHVSLPDVADRLRGSTDVLGELTVGDLSVRARLARFYSNLSSPQRAALHALANLPSESFDRSEGLAALAHVPDAGRVLDELTSLSLIIPADGDVVAHGVRYTMPRVHRLYAAAPRPRAAATGSTDPTGRVRSGPGARAGDDTELVRKASEHLRMLSHILAEHISQTEVSGPRQSSGEA